MQLVLSLMPGIDLLGYAFRLEGFTVVRGGDWIFGEDVRDEHYPSGRFDGVISGPPCQLFSRLAHIVRQNGHEPRFGNLIPEFERIVGEVSPTWWLMENVPDAPIPQVVGYETWSTLLNNRQLGEAQSRDRRWSFGARIRTPLMIETVALESAEFSYCGGDPATTLRRQRKMRSTMPWNHKGTKGFRVACRAQGLPEDFDIPAFTVREKCQAVRNGVPIPMGRAIARAVGRAVGWANYDTSL